MTEIKDNIDYLAALQSIVNWYNEAGIEVLSEENSINRIALIADARQKQATHLPISNPSAKIRYHGRNNPPTQKMPGLNVGETDTPKRGQAVLDKLSSESAQKAISIAQNSKSLSELEKHINLSEILSIQKTAKHTFLGVGNESADVLIINTAPSAQDDRSGQYMQDKDGALLDKMLCSIALSRNDVYLTNAVFWRPPGDRSPTQTEIATCLPIIEKIIQLVQPQFILTMGTQISQVFTGQNSAISKLRGKFYLYKTLFSPLDYSVQIRPFYTPQYLISSPALKQDAWHDLLALRDALNKQRD